MHGRASRSLSRRFGGYIQPPKMRAGGDRRRAGGAGDIAAEPRRNAWRWRKFSGCPEIAQPDRRFYLGKLGRRSMAAIIDAHLALKLHAKVTQTCVDHAGTIRFRISGGYRVRLRFVPAASLHEDSRKSPRLNPETLEGPDEIPYSGEVMDLGAALGGTACTGARPLSAQARRRIAADKSAGFLRCQSRSRHPGGAQVDKPANDRGMRSAVKMWRMTAMTCGQRFASATSRAYSIRGASPQSSF